MDDFTLLYILIIAMSGLLGVVTGVINNRVDKLAARLDALEEKKK